MKWIFTVLLALVTQLSHANELVVRQPNQSPVSISLNEMLTTLPQTTFQTQLPWYKKTHNFSGVKVTDLLDHLESEDVKAVSFVALNDYAATTKISDILSYEPIIAYLIDEKKLKVRNKGPFWLVFNLEKYPEIDNDIFYTQMVWQIDEVIIHNKYDK